jgi:hypothetical protein
MTFAFGGQRICARRILTVSSTADGPLKRWDHRENKRVLSRAPNRRLTSIQVSSLIAARSRLMAVAASQLDLRLHQRRHPCF